VVATLWLTCAGITVLLPALWHGSALGPYDLLSCCGLTKQPGVTLHSLMSSDQIQQMIPWNSLAWQQVHGGHLPLWNQFSVLGMPLAFNWQSSAFSLPSMISYLVPLDLAFTVSIMAKIVIAGTGVYVLCRVLGLAALPSVFAGTVFELCGSFAVWSGYPIATVAAWLGWVFAALIIVLRGDRRTVGVFLFAVAIAMSTYGGNPEWTIFVYLAVAGFTAVVLGARYLEDRDWRKLTAPLTRAGIGFMGGVALAAPLLLPGAEVASHSARLSSVHAGGLPRAELLNFVFSSYFGTPVAGSQMIGFTNYYSAAAYVGPVVLALAALAVIALWRRPEIIGISVVVLAFGAAIYLTPLTSFLDSVPVVQSFMWSRSLPLVCFGLAVLAAVGLDHLLKNQSDRKARHQFGGLLALAAGGLMVVGVSFALNRKGLNPRAVHIRAWSFAWPTVILLVGIALFVALLAEGRHGVERRPRKLVQGATLGLIIVQTGFLVGSGAILWSSTPTPIPVDPAVQALRQAVGADLVGVESCPTVDNFSSEGILPEMNVAYGIHQFTLYDSMIPAKYYSSWRRVSGINDPVAEIGLFCPAVSTTAIARTFGVSFVLAARGSPGPPGATMVRDVGDETLYSIPDSSRATVVPATKKATAPGLDPERPVAMASTGPSSYSVALDTGTRVDVHLRITDEPGWSASLDGRPVQLRQWNGVMLQAEVPPGRHTLVLRYWPRTFTYGIALAAASILFFTLAIGAQMWLARRKITASRGIDADTLPGEHTQDAQ